MFDPMSELSDESTSNESAPVEQDDKPAAQSQSGGGNGKFAQELSSVTIHARQRTFYIDLKESGHGKLFKVSEKSRGGQKTTIMFDSEDLEEFIKAFESMREFV